MKSPPPHKLAPRIWSYEAGQPPPDVRDGDIALPQRRSRAFGDGGHPTTRLCAGAVDVLMRGGKVANVLDVGTGTGVLARIARARGARWVAATDIDPVALESAHLNFALDHAPVEVTLADVPPDHWGAVFDLVVANILEAPLRRLAPALAGALADEGQLLVSGFTAAQAPALREVFQRENLAIGSDARMDEWVLLSFRRRAFTADSAGTCS